MPISKEELLRRLRPYGGRFLLALDAGLELWEFGWKEGFTTVADADGNYSKWQVDQIFLKLLRGKPDDWEWIGDKD